MTAIPRYRTHNGPAILSAGFRPFFLAGAVWAAVAIPLWLVVYVGGAVVPTLLQPLVWHAHEMVFGFAAAVVAGFLLTAIPNWTGRLPLQGLPLLTLVLLWAMGASRCCSPRRSARRSRRWSDAWLFRRSFSRLWRARSRRPELAQSADARRRSRCSSPRTCWCISKLQVADTAALGNRLGIAALLMLISLVGGRIVPSFTRNWLTKRRPDVTPPAPESGLDRAALIVTALGLACLAFAPDMASPAGCCSLPAPRWRCACRVGGACARRPSHCC